MSEKGTQKISRRAAATTGMMLAYRAQEAPDRMAVTTIYGERTFAELNARVNQLARAFHEAGLVPGDAVASLLKNRCEFLEVYFAALRTGLRITPINWHLTGDDVAYIVENCEAKAFLADEECANAAMETLAKSDGVKIALAIGGEIDGFRNYVEFIDRHSVENIDNPVTGTQMLYTSGTTGRPKGVHRDTEIIRQSTAIQENAIPGVRGSDSAGITPIRLAIRRLSFFLQRIASLFQAMGAIFLLPSAIRMLRAEAYKPETDRVLCTGPGYHTAPLAFNIVRPISRGVGIVMIDKWDAEDTLRLVEQYKITHTHMVATMFHRLLNLPGEVRDRYDISSLRFLLHGAAPCPVHLKQAMMDWLGPVIYEYYAATEGWGGFFIGPKEWLKKPGSVGKAPSKKSSIIIDEEGNKLPTGEIGTIYLKAPRVARFEYFKDETKTAETYMGDYYTLGDMGYFDEDRYLFLTGRDAETIISGGVNIYPQEVDNVLMKHPAIEDVCTIGVPNEEWGEEVKSVVQLNKDVNASEELAEQLIAFTQQSLSAYQCPRSIDFTSELPRLSTGKIQRHKVRERYWEGREKQI